MQIDSIQAYLLALPLSVPRPHPAGPIAALHTVLVRLQSGDVVGWGEAACGPTPLDSDEWAGGAFAALRDFLIPAVAGKWVESGDGLQKLLAPFRGNRFAKAAIDMAWWDAKARKEGQPLFRLLGAEREAVEVGPTFDEMDSIDSLFTAMNAAVADNYARVCLKFRPGWDVQVLNLVRHEFPVHNLHVDCEGALRLDHMELLCRLDDFSLTMVEQPLPADDLVGHAMVQEAVRTPICLDEGVTTVEQAEMALELKSCRFVKLDVGRVGGLTPAAAIYQTCHGECTPCWVGLPLSTGIAARAAYALAAKPNCSYPADLAASDFAAEIVPPPRPQKDPADGVQRVRLEQAPGIGVDPDMAVVQQHTVAQTP